MRGVADNNASLSHDLSSAIVSVGSSVKHRWKGDRGSAVTNCRSIGRVRERDTSVYAYICFRVNTLYNSYAADDLGDCHERESVVRKRERKRERERERKKKESTRKKAWTILVSSTFRRYIVTDLSPRVFATGENINNASHFHRYRNRECGQSACRFFFEHPSMWSARKWPVRVIFRVSFTRGFLLFCKGRQERKMHLSRWCEELIYINKLYSKKSNKLYFK